MEKKDFTKLPKVWCVNIREEKHHPRLDEFKAIMNTQRGGKFAYNVDYYGVNYSGKVCGRDWCGSLSHDFDKEHIISLDTFFSLID